MNLVKEVKFSGNGTGNGRISLVKNKIEKPNSSKRIGLLKTPGNDLLSHTVTRIVPSALRGLSALFGMGRGISPAALSPEKL
jgi:hypothetical protein